MRKKYLPFTVGIILIIFLSYFSMRKFSTYKSCKLGDSIAVKVDSFKILQHRLPKSLYEMGIEEDLIYYRLLDSNTYELSFPLPALGESALYRSDERTWYIPD
jgi:hypothetical protein